MRRALALACMALLAVTPASPQILPGIFFGASSGGGGGCSNTLDLSQTCNLVYYRVVTR